MNDLSPRAGLVVPAVASEVSAVAEGNTIASGLLSALPFASAVLSTVSGVPYVAHWNECFARMLEAFLDRSSAPQPPWVIECLDEIANFATGDAPRRTFQFERFGLLGPEAFCATLAWIPDGTDNPTDILFTVIDRTAQRRVEENLRRELVSDSLTTLANRVGFGEMIERMASEEGRDPASFLMVMVIDVERFGRVNESMGSLVGDELILTVAKRLNGIRQPGLGLARLGGDEFAIAVPIANGVSGVIALADMIRNAMAKPVRLGGYQVAIECAMGCALASVHEADGDVLIRRAQSAVRVAKKTGRLEIYRGGELKAAERRFLVESRLRDALAAGALRLVYQPLIDLATGAVIGFEALSRWTDEELGVVSPLEFIAAAEESGLIVQLGRWSLNEAMQQLSRWDRAVGERLPVSMNVNVSQIQVVRDDLLSTVSSALRLAGIDGKRLTLELTESAIIDDPDNCRSLLAALKGFEVQIAMDDFGTGFSNLASLQSLPIDVLKIDQSFVITMLSDPDKYAITRAIQSLAQALKLRTTAEGIETAELATALRDMGCTTGQGYFFARPMEPDQALAYWRSRRRAATA